MLMPSAFSCDASQQHYQSYPHTRLQSALFASPPASPPTLTSTPAIGNIFNTCRSLQSLLTTPPPPERAQLTQLPTPPMAHAPSPIKLRLRPRAPRPDNSSAPDSRPRKKIIEADSESDADVPAMPAAPSTPKRARIAPEVIPLGLARTDYHNLHAASDTNLPLLNLAQGSGVEVERDGEHWSTEDDRILVELVLEKLRLSKTEWQDCARSLGKDRNSLSRRWRSLMAQGDVGLKPTRASRRGKLHGTW
ncbi:ATP synthase D chain [Verticillium dahliae VDG1]|nr:ATP synthase D chain [Verticillium dahliae VDG1]